ncbi:MAG: PriCT-2 domain-containing protein [Pseudomonadota bacterium]|nr:PriCT-2 domain-containing protein [Gammaproteobacteria bacterium]MDQ3581389.1 PriCT-2 domain-containing protein [Pseudomonadota bacterium]
MNARDYERVRSALAFIPPDDRDMWVNMGMAIKDGFGDEGFDLWDAWSRQSDRYNERDARDVWRSLKAGGGITLGDPIPRGQGARLARRRDAPRAYPERA